ncbi:hypothetical protein GGE65_005845 [Skermanella aerolata]
MSSYLDRDGADPSAAANSRTGGTGHARGGF